jgi:hypothetical protein
VGHPGELTIAGPRSAELGGRATACEPGTHAGTPTDEHNEVLEGEPDPAVVRT